MDNNTVGERGLQADVRVPLPVLPWPPFPCPVPHIPIFGLPLTVDDILPDGLAGETASLLEGLYSRPDIRAVTVSNARSLFDMVSADPVAMENVRDLVDRIRGESTGPGEALGLVKLPASGEDPEFVGIVIAVAVLVMLAGVAVGGWLGWKSRP